VNPQPSSRPALLLVLGFLLVPSAWAQTDLVALHPCVITDVRDKQQVDDLQHICDTEIARDVQRVPPEQVRAFLDKEAKGSCARAKKPAECLGRLATATQASRAVLITLSPGNTGQRTQVSSLVVSSKSEVVDEKRIQPLNRNQPREEHVRTTITILRKQLDLGPSKLAPPVEQPPSPPLVATPAPEPTPVPAPAAPPPERAYVEETVMERQQALSTGRTWKTPAAYASAGTGVAALGLAVFLAIDGNNAMLESNKYYANNNLPVRSELERIADLREEATDKRTLAGVSAAVGAALAGTGVYLWLSDRPASPTPGAAALLVGPGGISVHGVLP
jgi:hypothetical protein